MPSSQIPIEIALEHLCYIIFEKTKSSSVFGLKLPDGTSFDPQSGIEHFHKCLRALAEYPKCP